MTYSNPGTPDSSTGSPVSPETVILDSNSNDQDLLEILDQKQDPGSQELLANIMNDLKQTTIMDNIQDNTIQSDGFHPNQHQSHHEDHEDLDDPFINISEAAADDLLSAVLNATQVTELEIVTENDKVFHQMQNMK